MNTIRLADLKVSELKVELQKRKLPSKGKKIDLVKSLRNELDSSYLVEESPNKLSSNVDKKSQSCKWINSASGKIAYLEAKVAHLERTIDHLYKCFKKVNNKISYSSSRNIKSNTATAISLETKTTNTQIPNANSDTLTLPTKNTQMSQSTAQCSRNIERNCTVNSVKPKILIVGDSHVRNFSSIINSLNSENYSVQTFCKPNAKLEDVISNIDSLSADMDKHDYVIIMAGNNDILKGTSIKKDNLNKCLNNLKHTNSIVCSIPFSKNKPILNHLVYEANVILYEAAKNHNKDVWFFDVNKILKFHHFQIHGIHLNNNGKITLCRFLINIIKTCTQQTTSINFRNCVQRNISTGDYICKSNLIEVTPTSHNFSNVEKQKCITNNINKLYPTLPQTDDDLQELLVQDSSISRDKEIIIQKCDRAKKSQSQDNHRTSCKHPLNEDMFL